MRLEEHSGWTTDTTGLRALELPKAAVLEARWELLVPFQRPWGGLNGIYICIILCRRLYGLNKIKGGVMKTLRLTVFLVMACTLVLLASQSAFGAIKIIKFAVPSCE